MRTQLVGLLLVVLWMVSLGLGCDENKDEPIDITGRTLSWVAVEGGRLVDQHGRQWQLRGVNARIEHLFDVVFDDGRERLEPIPEFSREDAAAMAGAGYNVLRLPINWSGLEPTEGAFSEAYLQRVDQVIDWCAEFGIYVLVDFHQDAYSKEFGEDGAPLWAIVPPPSELLEGPLHDLDARRTSYQVMAAFDGFFNNKEGIQDRFLPAWEHVVRRYRKRPEVIGFELMNEPVSFLTDPTEELLHDFYEKFAAAMRAIDGRHTLWLEPDATRNFNLSSPLRNDPFPDDNVVYAPHLYPGLADVDATTVADWKQGLADTFASLLDEADSWGAAVVLGEWGTHPEGEHAQAYIQAIQELTLEHQVGEVFWLWKENCQGFWGLYDYDDSSATWSRREEGFARVATPYAMAVPGRLLSQSLDRAARRLTVTFETEGGEAAPLLYLGLSFFSSPTPQIRVGGLPVAAEIDPDTHRALVTWDGQPGTHTLTVED